MRLNTPPKNTKKKFRKRKQHNKNHYKRTQIESLLYYLEITMYTFPHEWGMIYFRDYNEILYLFNVYVLDLKSFGQFYVETFNLF